MNHAPVVTIAVPLYKRLQLLPQALASVVEQRYPEIDLIVSDNGENGDEVRTMVEEHYPGPFRYRRNERTVPVHEHFNQLIAEARGEYFLVLADDDQLGDNFVGGLVSALQGDPDVGLAIARMRVIDEEGRLVDAPESASLPPDRMTGTEFNRIWCRNEYDFVSFITVMGRTADLRRVEGYPDFAKHGTGIDNMVALRLALGRKVAFVKEACFHNRVYEASHGLSLSIEEYAADLRRYLRFLDDDVFFKAFARTRSEEWKEVRDLQRRMVWKTYRYRWKYMYRSRLDFGRWARAAFLMPIIPEYYASVVPYLGRVGLSGARQRLRGAAAL
jgi:glycosyltransferase involved in cell wall biosynthesis